MGVVLGVLLFFVSRKRILFRLCAGRRIREEEEEEEEEGKEEEEEGEEK